MSTNPADFGVDVDMAEVEAELNLDGDDWIEKMLS